MKMPSLKALHSHRASTPSHLFVADGRSAVWARSNTDDVSISQLHKFWSGLSPAARRELLRIDKQALFEQVRKNLYCSRCHGLLVEGYAQIVSYGKNLQAGLRGYSNGSATCSKHISEVGTTGANASLQDDTKDPSVHPWGGLAATRDSMLTVLDCFLDGTPLEVFESARARERERELLYPDACGGGGRGWISQSSGSFGSNGRGHGMKDTCALHTARLSCEALVDFWSALGEETRRSLLRMKEEDFIERLMFRFDSKRFCRDCRRNVLREFKEMKELKRTRKEPRCTRWFCTADTVFRYEVSDSVLQVDWRDSFAGDGGSTYQRFEWALGTAEGKADLLGFEDVGLSESIHVEGLDLANTAACYIMVRGYKRDGRFTELSARAHALKGQLCVHRRLIVGDGYVSITKGESIQRFFERAEETEEEEDEDSMDKDGNELEGEGSRPQKHAKSPELARDFLLDAATVIFKEQVEKAFREGTARQNAHSIFVCLALNLLEERVRVACKEITTLEKQNKLLEEEEDERREEEERRERRKLKEKEKKLRRREKLKGKERDKEKSKSLANSSKTTPNGSVSGLSIDNEDLEPGVIDQEEDFRSDFDSVSARPPSPDMAQARSSGDGLDRENGAGNGLDLSSAHEIEDTLSTRDGNGAFIVERTKSSKRRSQSRQAEGGQSGQPRREILDSGVGARTFAKVAQSSVVEHFTVQDKGIVSQQVHSKSNGLAHESDNIPKRVDAWHRGNGHVQHKLEDFQHCACGGPQTTNLRAKGGHRSIARVVNKEVPSSRAGERVDYGIRGVASNATLDFGYSQDKQDGSKGKISAVPTTKRKGEREQERMDPNFGEVVRHGLSRSSSVGELSECAQNGYGPSSSNPWHPVENVASSGPTEMTTNSNPVGVPVSRSSMSTDRTSSHGSSKGMSARPTGKARTAAAPAANAAATVVHGKPGVLPLPAAVTDSRPVVQVDQNSGSWYSNGGQSTVSNHSVLAGTTTSSTANVAAKPHIVGISDSPAQSVLGSASDSGGTSSRVGDQTLNLSEQPKVVLENLDTGGGGGGGVVDHGRNTSSSLTGEAYGHQPTDAGLSQSAAGSQAPAPLGTQTTGLRVAQVSAAKEMMAPNGPIRPVQIPAMMPAPPIHMHHPPSNFGFYQWGGGRPRNGVLPLPQTGGFLVPGLNSLGVPMGCLPPMSLAQNGPQGLGLGRLPAFSNGLNSLQLRDPVFLSRYTTGPSPGGEGDGKIPTIPLEDHVNPVTPGDESIPGIQTRDSLSAPQEAEAASAGSNLSAMQKEIVNDSSPDTTGFSLFHFSGPEAVAQKELDSSSVVPPLKESTADKTIETSPDVSKCAAMNDSTGGAPDSSTTAGEYSLFATAGKGLVFF